MVSDMEVLDDVTIVACGMHESRDNVSVESCSENCTPGQKVPAFVQGEDDAGVEEATTRPGAAAPNGSCG